MKYMLIVFLAFTVLQAAVGQNGFSPAFPDQPVDFSQVSDSGAWVRGHWVASDPADKQSQLTGPSTSEISCDRERTTCTDTTANIVVMGNTFSLYGGQDEYNVERWNAKEIVASNVGGACRLRNVIKFDRAQKRVYSMQTLSEPIDDLTKKLRDTCKLSGMTLEPKNSTMWRIH